MRGLTLALIGLFACSPANTEPVCTTYEVPVTLDLTTPVVSLRNDVVPIFSASCAFTSCHGTKSTTSNNGLYLGSQLSAPDVPAIRMSLLAKAVPIDMPIITPSDPSQSYLMHKIDGDACKLCSGACGKSMPNNSPVMSVDRRDVIRRWIAQGAKDN